VWGGGVGEGFVRGVCGVVEARDGSLLLWCQCFVRGVCVCVWFVLVR
jgi:hypothetical protein